jgi:hypothetical protein
MFTARYALSPYIKQTRFVFKGLKMEVMGCPQRSVTNYQSTLRNIPDERRPHAADCCEHGHKPSGSEKWRELLDQLRNSFYLLIGRTVLHGVNWFGNLILHK